MGKIFDIGIRQIRERTNSLFAEYRRNKLNRLDFSIISNNCWAGTVYRYFGLPYLSPTAGLYFFPKDYIKFISNLRYYLAIEPIIIDTRDSKHFNDLRKKHEESVLVGRIDDVEIVFLHYHSASEAIDKWNRRSKRVNFNNLFIKFSQMNGCTVSDLITFDSIKFANKICFTANNYPNLSSCVCFSNEDSDIINDTDRFDKCIDIYDWLNKQPAEYNL